MRHGLDRIAHALARLLVRVFYRRTEVVGAERIPAAGPLLLVANHGNSLIDPILLLALLPRLPRFLAKHTLWDNPAVRPLLELGGALPVRRLQDAAGGSDPARNLETFARCYEELAGGGCVALFPEGISHHEPRLQPLKTGAARLALGAEETRGPLGLRIVPVGLEFEEKTRFRSRALVVVGEPIDPASVLSLHRSEPQAAVRALTEQIRVGLTEVTANHGSWREAVLVERAADLLGEEERLLPGLAPLARRFTLRRALAATYRGLQERQPERARQVEQLLWRYDALLARHELRDDQVAARYPWRDVAAHLLDRVPVLAVWLPAAALGVLLNAVPALVARIVGRSVAAHPDLPATFKLLAGFFGFPLWWLTLGLVSGAMLGSGTGLILALLAPPSGFAALRFREEYARLLREARAWLALHVQPARARRIRQLRRALRGRLRDLSGSTRDLP